MQKHTQTNISASKHRFIITLVTFLSLFAFGVVIISLSLFGIPNRSELTSTGEQVPQVYQQSGQQANSVIELIPNETSLTKDRESSFRVELDTKDNVVTGASAVVRFNKDQVTITKLDISGAVFGKIGVHEYNQGGGYIHLEEVVSSIDTTYKGRGKLATVYFVPKTKDKITFTVDCANSGAYKGADNLLNCSGVKGVEYSSISDGVGGNPPSDNNNLRSDSGPHKEPWCQKESPERPTNLKAVTGTKAGTVKLTWTKSQNTSHYTVTFGEKWMDFKYGSPNIGDTDQFLVTGLRPGVMYYFVVTAVNVCASSGYSDGAQAYAGKSTYTGTSVRTTPRPKSKATLAPLPTTTPVLETPPQATSSGFYDDWDTTTLNVATPTPEPVATLAPVQQTGGSVLLTLAKVLPWVGLVVLVILGIMLVRFIKGGSDQELPPLKQNFTMDDSTDVPPAPTQPQQPQQPPSDPLAPPFGQ